jgi:hypothetical protein
MKASLLSRQKLAPLHFIWIATVCLLATGCIADQNVWRYAPDSYPIASKSLAQIRLVVLPFKDSRPDSNTNAEALALIPLMPYGWCDLSFPEAGGPSYCFPLNGFVQKKIQPQQFKPKEDFARGAAEELRASGLFKEVVFSPHPSEEDLVLYGKVTSTRYYRTLVTYGLSFVGLWLQLFGVPAGTFTNELAIEFQLGDRVTGAVLWHKNYQDSYKTTYWVYNYPRHFNYDTLYKPMLRDVVESLRAELARPVPGKLD